MNDIDKTTDIINSLKDSIELKNKLERLENNNDFKELILNKFCKDYAIACLNNSIKYPEEEYKYLKEAQAIAIFTAWIESIITKGNTAQEQLPEQESYLISLKNGE